LAKFRTREWRPVVALPAMAIITTLLILGCSGGGGGSSTSGENTIHTGTPTGTSTLTVTASQGAISRTLQLVLNVS
jgi:hypothetical protein